MKFIKLRQLLDTENVNPIIISEIWLNKDIMRSVTLHSNRKKNLTYSEVILIADDKPLNILETPDEINNLCNFIQEVKIHGIEFTDDECPVHGSEN
jgi:hypothetical protein